MVDRPKSQFEEMGDRLFQVVKDHANDTEPSLELLAEIAWALDLYPRFALLAKAEAFFAEKGDDQ